MIHAETERLIMRDLLPSDAEAMFEMDSDPEVQRYLGNKPVKHIDEITAVIAIINKQYQDFGIGRWAVIEKATGSFIGWAGLKWIDSTINGHTQYYDVGYRFIKRYWGRGYATEVAKASVQYGLDILKTSAINGIANVDNKASINVLKKAGLLQGDIFEYEDIPHFWFALPK